MFSIGFFLLGFGFGLLLGYAFFYFRYKDRNVIDTLRNNYEKCKKELEEKNNLVKSLEQEKEVLVKEYTHCEEQLNYLMQILKDNAINLKKMEEAAKKTKELYNILKDFDEDLIEKAKEIVEKVDPSCNILEGEEEKKQSFF